MKFVLQVQGPKLPIDDWIAAAPMVIDRIRSIRYDRTGAAVVDGIRSDRLQLVDGRAGQVGSAYLLSEPEALFPRPSEPDPRSLDAPDTRGFDESDPHRPVAPTPSPVAFTVVADDTERIQLEAHSTGEQDPMGATVELSNPRRPHRVSGVASMDMVNFPVVLGRSVELAGEVTLTGFNFTEEPQIRFDLASRWIKAKGTVHLRPTADGYEIVVHAKPRGVGRLIALGWAIVKGQVIEAAQTSISQRLVAIHAQHSEFDGPQQLADEVWAGIVNDLTDR